MPHAGLSATGATAVPVRYRVHLAHAALQAVADRWGADVLHIKGPAVPSCLGLGERRSFDADILVRPGHLALLLEGLRTHGWREMKPLATHGVVEHSTTWFHGDLGEADIHLRFPGIQVAPAQAFERLWRDRVTEEIAHRSCTVPDPEHHRLILLLHAARDMERHANDAEMLWEGTTASQREGLLRLAMELDSEVALAAATGRLEVYRDRAEYALWRLYVDGTLVTSGFRKLEAQVGAAPAGSGHVRILVAKYAVNSIVHLPQRLAEKLGRRPTAAEVARAYGRLVHRGADIFRPLR